MGNVDKNLAKNVIQLRKKKGWTQAMLAEFIDVSQYTVSLIEAHKTWPGIKLIRKLAKAFEIDEEELFISRTWLEKNPTKQELLDFIEKHLFLR